MKKGFILYETDFKHSTSSRDLKGVFTTKAKLMREVSKIIKADYKANSNQHKVDMKLSTDWLIKFFDEKLQTQGLLSFELYAEEITLNEII